MKKLLFVLLTAALALPMMAQTKVGMDNGWRHASVPGLTTLKAHKVAVNATRDEIPADMAMITYTVGDVWGDGSGYQMLLDADATAYGTIIPESGPLTTSGDADASIYAEFEYKIPENADGSLTTSNIVINNTVSILIPAGVYDFMITNPTPGDRMWIAASQGTLGGRGDDIEFAGGYEYVITTYLASNGNDMTDMIDPFAPVAVEGLNVTVDGTNANVAWTNDHDPAFNLRYRVYDPNMAFNMFWDFETDESLEGWTILDYDGDGYNWGIYSGYGVDGSTCLGSASYDWGALSPDNWLFSPEVALGGTLTFKIANQSSYYPDKIAVYAIAGDIDYENFDPEAWVKISDDITPGTAYEEYSFEIPAELRGNGHFAFRHYDCYDEYRIYIDDVTYEVPGNEPGEWTVVEGIEGNEYLLEGLDPETTYEVQVQAMAADGRTTDWTESVLFTTAEAGEQPTDYCERPECAYAITDFETVTVTITNNEPGATVVYEVYCEGELIDSGEFTGDEYAFT
ncbi:MAG: DUF2436 domain-containing protein, partial [Muribaculaceae bacterium]|nr:DUF2436 domain-containing protein [Muribaculaceae bacterium]